VICPTGEAKYFCKGDWTGKISLIRLDNFAFWRTGSQSRWRSIVARSDLSAVAQRAKADATEAIWKPSFRGDAKHRTRNFEIPGLVLRTIPE
jgi:hypothetical protein